MSLLQAIILGLVQGLTEFLPISSSGHLVLGESLLKVKFDDISFEVFLHLGTLLAVVIFFRHSIWKMLRAVWFKVKSILIKNGTTSYLDEDWRLFWLIVLGSVPAGLIGVGFKDFLEKTFSSVRIVSVMLLFTGSVLFLTRFFKGLREKLKWGDAIWVGLAQAIAILPGVSRSGLTISAGIFRKVEPGKAAEFSFLLSLPAVIGACVLELKDVVSQSNTSRGLGIYLAGAVTALIVGYLAIKFLLKVIKRGKFQYFGYYCFALGFFFLIFTR
ncbi:MAG TPA: undecaprenyl-diphosphate phosphatase [candidate division Zixibacteria bacterium]